MTIVNELHITKEEHESMLSFYDFAVQGAIAVNRTNINDYDFNTAWHQLKADIEYLVDFYGDKHPDWIDE